MAEPRSFRFQFDGWIPSTNHIYGTGKGGRKFLKKEVRQFRNVIALLARAAMVRYKCEAATENESVEVQIAAAVDRGRDLDNILKSFLDALKGVAFKDDSQVDGIAVLRMKKKFLTERLTIQITLSERIIK